MDSDPSIPTARAALQCLCSCWFQVQGQQEGWVSGWGRCMWICGARLGMMLASV